VIGKRRQEETARIGEVQNYDYLIFVRHGFDKNSPLSKKMV